MTLAGAILEGPSEDTLKPLAVSALSTFLPMLRDPSNVVRDSVAWLVGHICDTVPSSIDASVLPGLLEALYVSLDDEPRVAKNICWVGVLLDVTVLNVQSIVSLVEVVFEAAQNDAQESDIVETYALSSAYGTMVGKLLEVAQRFV